MQFSPPSEFSEGVAEPSFMLHKHVFEMQDPRQSYFNGLPEQFVMLADATLVAEDVRLPVHQAILAANSSFFGEIFLTAREHQSEHEDTLHCPLPGDKLEDVLTVLKYCYQSCRLFSCSKPALVSAQDACSLARFAHKYDMRPLLQECEVYLISQAQLAEANHTSIDVSAIVTWVLVAETCHLMRLLAHCELVLAKSWDVGCWQHNCLMSNESISRSSLLRILRAAQHHTIASEHRMQQIVVNRYNCFSHTSSCYVTVETLMAWQQVKEKPSSHKLGSNDVY